MSQVTTEKERSDAKVAELQHDSNERLDLARELTIADQVSPVNGVDMSVTTL